MSAEVIRLTRPQAAPLRASGDPDWIAILDTAERDLIIYVVEDDLRRPWLTFEIAAPAPLQNVLVAAIALRDHFGADAPFRDFMIERAAARGTYRPSPRN